MLPEFLIAASVITCERVLNEMDRVQSFIRVVDLFYIPEELVLPSEQEDTPPPIVIPITGVAFFKSVPGHHGHHRIKFTLINTTGEATALGEEEDFELGAMLADVPGGGSIGVAINLVAKRFGVCYLVVYLDGIEVARNTITLQPQRPNQRQS